MSDLHFLDPNPSGKPAVLFLHGLGADGASWLLQLPVLGNAGFRPIAVDAPGFGHSPYDGRGWTIRRVAGQMAGLLEELGTGPANVVGLSMGGVIAQQFAMDFPHLTRKLVLTSTFTVLRPESLDGWVYFLRRAAVVLFAGMQAQAQIVAQRVFPDPRDQALREMFLTIISRADPRAYRKAMLSLGWYDSRKRLGQIKAPTLVVTGAEDTTVSPSRQKVLAQGIPAARQLVIPNAGHAVPVDQAEAFNRVLLDFFQE
jgi:pimeloyl-ACP methyl ester carboxylesterase